MFKLLSLYKFIALHFLLQRLSCSCILLAGLLNPHLLNAVFFQPLLSLTLSDPL